MGHRVEQGLQEVVQVPPALVWLVRRYRDPQGPVEVPVGLLRSHGLDDLQAVFPALGADDRPAV